MQTRATHMSKGSETISERWVDGAKRECWCKLRLWEWQARRENRET
jgi:hypothetical protein